MAAEKGRAFLAKIGDGGTPTELFTTVAGLRSTSMTINDEAVDITNKDSGGWRELLAGAGVKNVSVSGSGVFKNSQAELDVQAKIMATPSVIANWELEFENGAKFAGAFQVTQLQYTGEHNGERTYTWTLESSGTIAFTAGS